MAESTSEAASNAASSSSPNVAEIVANLRRTFRSEKTKPAAWRMQQLNQIQKLITENEQEIATALKTDLSKPYYEAFVAEINSVLGEVRHAIKHLSSWMKPKSVSNPLVNTPGKCEIVKDPLGVILVIAPWNFPFQLGMNPIIGAVAAGNCVLLKPSELAPATSAMFAKLIPQYLDKEAVVVVEGGVDITTEILQQRFDHILYTGGAAVARIIMTAAARFLTPVTLELGGKSPCIVDKDVNLEVAARRICWGKFGNCGQVCIAPDYILVMREVHDALVAKMKEAITDFYGQNPKESESYARIINTRHTQRIAGLINEAPEQSVEASQTLFTVAFGGEVDVENRYIAPTLLTNVNPSAKVMQEEIFGPVLPIIAIDSIDQAVDFVNEREKPLALYIFSSNSSVQNRVISRTSSGGVGINECLKHAVMHELPFGGVGESGMGAYHGKYSFDTFTHNKSVLGYTTMFDLAIRYPPYNDDKLWYVKKLM